ncbi:MAG: 1-acyl-sn-glycerol-3-phosphate acyltransferase [Myxococcota bacterium]
MTERRKKPRARHDKSKRPGSPPGRPDASRSGGGNRHGAPRAEFARGGSNQHSRADRPRQSEARAERGGHGRSDARPGRSNTGSREARKEGPPRERRDEREAPQRPRYGTKPARDRRPPAVGKSDLPRASLLDQPPKAVPTAPRVAPELPEEPPLLDQDLDYIEGDFVEEENDGDFMEEAPELGIGARVVPPNLRYEGEASVTTPIPSSPPPRDVEAQIRSLEARLDGLIRRAALSEEGDEPSEETQAISVAPPPFVTTTTDNATRDYVARRWGREALRNRAEEVDDFGLDPSFERKVLPGLELLYRRYFRVQIEGMENVPRAGRAVIVANHSGALPLDGMMLRTAMRLDHPGVRDLRWLAEDFLFYLPFAGVFLNRIGAVRACQENAERLLSHDGLLAVFPEGVQGIRKLFKERYQLQRFGRGGYIRLCLRMRAPLVPCAIIGGEETNPLVYRFDRLAEFLKLPYLPVTPTFPWLGPLGLLPAPARWKIRFGEPLSFESYGPEAADDDVLVGRLSERVRSSIQSLLDTGLRERKSVWFG